MYVIGFIPQAVPWPKVQQNWYLGKYDPMYVSWNVRYAVDQLQWIIVPLICLSYGKTPNRVNRTSMIVFLLWAFFDTISYFYNDKTRGYYIVWALLALSWWITYKLLRWTTQLNRKK